MTKYAQCSCMMLAYDGIPSRHSLLMLKNASIARLPDHCIKDGQKWQQSAFCLMLMEMNLVDVLMQCPNLF